MLKKILSVTVPTIAMACIVGCSSQSPVSVNESSSEPAKTAMFYDASFDDLGGCGGYIWGTSSQPIGSTIDSYLYYFQPRTATWIQSSHWGYRVAVSSSGKCFHVNSNNQIWVCKTLDLNGINERDSSGFVAYAPSGESIADIAAGNISSSTDRIWILCRSNKHVYRGDVTPNVTFTWTQVATPSFANNVNAISADPSKGTRVIIATNVGADTLISDTNWGGIQYSLPNLDDACISRNNLFYFQYNCLYQQVLNNWPSGKLYSGTAYQGISVDPAKYMYLTYNGTPYYYNLPQ